MGKYDAWRDYLDQEMERTVKMTFDQLNVLSPLPSSALKYQWWWKNGDLTKKTHVQCRSWQAAGFKAEVDMAGRTVTFRRD
jgi:hypothetical protein